MTTVIVLGAAVGFGLHARPSFTATAVTYVNPGATPKNPGQAQEAADLATTYAGLIPDDSAILHSLARTLGQSAKTVHKSITVVTPTGTGILRLEYKAHSAAAAMVGATALARSITGPHAVSNTVPPSSVLLASLPTKASRGGASLILLVPVGLLLSILLGSVLLAIWEWLDPRVDVSPQLASALGTPVSDEHQLRDGAADVLVQRWVQAVPPGGVIALVAARAEDIEDVERLTSHLSDLASRHAKQLSQPLNPSGVTKLPALSTAGSFVGYGAPGTAQVGQQAALTSSTVVLVAVAGVRLSDVERSRRLLGHFGHEPDWGLLLPSDPARRLPLLAAGTQTAENDQPEEDRAPTSQAAGADRRP